MPTSPEGAQGCSQGREPLVLNATHANEPRRGDRKTERYGDHGPDPDLPALPFGLQHQEPPAADHPQPAAPINTHSSRHESVAPLGLPEPRNTHSRGSRPWLHTFAPLGRARRPMAKYPARDTRALRTTAMEQKTRCVPFPSRSGGPASDCKAAICMVAKGARYIASRKLLAARYPK